MPIALFFSFHKIQPKEYHTILQLIFFLKISTLSFVQFPTRNKNIEMKNEKHRLMYKSSSNKKLTRLKIGNHTPNAQHSFSTTFLSFSVWFLKEKEQKVADLRLGHRSTTKKNEKTIKWIEPRKIKRNNEQMQFSADERREGWNAENHLRLVFDLLEKKNHECFLECLHLVQRPMRYFKILDKH